MSGQIAAQSPIEILVEQDLQIRPAVEACPWILRAKRLPDPVSRSETLPEMSRWTRPLPDDQTNSLRARVYRRTRSCRRGFSDHYGKHVACSCAAVYRIGAHPARSTRCR